MPSAWHLPRVPDCVVFDVQTSTSVAVDIASKGLPVVGRGSCWLVSRPVGCRLELGRWSDRWRFWRYGE